MWCLFLVVDTDCCLLIAVCCVSCVGRCLWFVEWCCALVVVCCVLFDVCCCFRVCNVLCVVDCVLMFAVIRRVLLVV